jgi:hypothetical protein
MSCDDVVEISDDCHVFVVTETLFLFRRSRSLRLGVVLSVVAVAVDRWLAEVVVDRSGEAG